MNERESKSYMTPRAENFEVRAEVEYDKFYNQKMINFSWTMNGWQYQGDQLTFDEAKKIVAALQDRIDGM